MDLLAFVLSAGHGDAKVKMSPQVAASWGYFDPRSNTWNEDVLGRQLGSSVAARLLPGIAAVGQEVGRTPPPAAGSFLGRFGIGEGVPVTVPTGDMQVIDSHEPWSLTGKG